MQGDAQNFAPILHWDGFSTAKTNKKNCWVVDLIILNARKVDPIGPILVLFILSSSDKFIKHADCNILTFVLAPLVRDLETFFVKEFPVLYAYPTEVISDKLPLIPINELITLRAMVTLCTGDHPIQCKIGRLKMGGYACCRRHKVAFRWRGIPNINNGLVEYHDNRKQHKYAPVNHTSKDTVMTLANWRQLPNERQKDAIGREAEISGYSILWRLHDLYGFDILRDLVYDVMHILSLCIFNKYVHMILKYAEQNGRVRDIGIAMEVAKNIRPRGLGARWSRNL